MNMNIQGPLLVMVSHDAIGVRVSSEPVSAAISISGSGITIDSIYTATGINDMPFWQRFKLVCTVAKFILLGRL